MKRFEFYNGTTGETREYELDEVYRAAPGDRIPAGEVVSLTRLGDDGTARVLSSSLSRGPTASGSCWREV